MGKRRGFSFFFFLHFYQLLRLSSKSKVLIIRVLYNKAWLVVNCISNNNNMDVCGLFTFQVETEWVRDSSYSKATLSFAFWWFSQAREEVEIKTITIHHRAAYLIYVSTHNKQFLLSHIFMLSIDFYEYHKNKKLMVLSALLPTHGFQHNTFKSNLPGSMWYTWILIFICIDLKELRNH